jgi:hypothetical protein
MTIVQVLLLLFAGQAHAADRLPKLMLGKWASDPAACGEQASESGLTVERRSVSFYEHGYDIRRIVRLKDGSLKASGFSVDDQGRARGSVTLKLVGDKLQVDGQTYHRCKSENETIHGENARKMTFGTIGGLSLPPQNHKESTCLPI